MFDIVTNQEAWTKFVRCSLTVVSPSGKEYKHYWTKSNCFSSSFMVVLNWFFSIDVITSINWGWKCLKNDFKSLSTWNWDNYTFWSGNTLTICSARKFRKGLIRKLVYWCWHSFNLRLIKRRCIISCRFIAQ